MKCLRKVIFEEEGNIERISLSGRGTARFSREAVLVLVHNQNNLSAYNGEAQTECSPSRREPYSEGNTVGSEHVYCMTVMVGTTCFQGISE